MLAENIDVVIDRVHPRINRVCHYHMSRLPAPKAEVMSECYMGFVDAYYSFDETKGAKFESWLVTKINHRINQWIERIQGKRGHRKHEWSFADYDVDCFDPPESETYRLSEDATLLIAMALKPPQSVLEQALAEGSTKKDLRRALRYYFYGRGWTCGRVRSAFLEVRRALEEHPEQVRRAANE